MRSLVNAGNYFHGLFEARAKTEKYRLMTEYNLANSKSVFEHICRWWRRWQMRVKMLTTISRGLHGYDGKCRSVSANRVVTSRLDYGNTMFLGSSLPDRVIHCLERGFNGQPPVLWCNFNHQRDDRRSIKSCCPAKTTLHWRRINYLWLYIRHYTQDTIYLASLLPLHFPIHIVELGEIQA